MVVEGADVAERVGRLRSERRERRIDPVGSVCVREVKHSEVRRRDVRRAHELQHLVGGALVGRAQLLLPHAAEFRRRHEDVDAGAARERAEVLVVGVLRCHVGRAVADGSRDLPEHGRGVGGSEVGVGREARPEHHAGAEGIGRLRSELAERHAIGCRAVEERGAAGRRRVGAHRVGANALRENEQDVRAAARAAGARERRQRRGGAERHALPHLPAALDPGSKRVHRPVNEARVRRRGLQEATVDLVGPEAHRGSAEQEGGQERKGPREPGGEPPGGAEDARGDDRAHEHHPAEEPGAPPGVEPVGHGPAKSDAETHGVAPDVRVEDAMVERLSGVRRCREGKDPEREENAEGGARSRRPAEQQPARDRRGAGPEGGADEERARVDGLGLSGEPRDRARADRHVEHDRERRGPGERQKRDRALAEEGARHPGQAGSHDGRA